jgi:hypothetical protein
VKRIIDGDAIIAITPELIAELWCNLDASEQASFFNEVGHIASAWRAGGPEFQLQYITDDHGLNLAGRRVMQSIGDYSHWGLVPNITRIEVSA